jgi:hypothetical protein
MNIASSSVSTRRSSRAVSTSTSPTMAPLGGRASCGRPARLSRNAGPSAAADDAAARPRGRLPAGLRPERLQTIPWRDIATGGSARPLGRASSEWCAMVAAVLALGSVHVLTGAPRDHRVHEPIWRDGWATYVCRDARSLGGDGRWSALLLRSAAARRRVPTLLSPRPRRYRCLGLTGRPRASAPHKPRTRGDPPPSRRSSPPCNTLDKRHPGAAPVSAGRWPSSSGRTAGCT